MAQDLGPTLHSVQVLSPDLKKLFVNLNPLITVSKTGLAGGRPVPDRRAADAGGARRVPRAAATRSSTGSPCTSS